MSADRRDWEPVLNPQQGVNDTDAELLRWYVNDGDHVASGQILCEMETAKAAYDLSAPAAGLIKTISQPGEHVRVNQEVAVIFASTQAYEVGAASVHRKFREALGGSQTLVTEKARKLAESLGIQVAEIKTASGIVREKDVRDHAQRAGAGEGGGARGRISDGFLRTLSEDAGFRNLPSEEKARHYMDNGACIGSNVTFAAGSVVIANYIDIGDGTVFGDHAFVKAERFRIGTMGVLGAHASVVTRSIWIGDAFYSGSHISIGGGGAFGARSGFRCGDNCLVSSQCIINTGEPVVFGNEVGLSPRVQIYTHSHWQDVFEGFAASFGPVTIGDHSYLTGNVMVVPGVTLGRGCTVLANSVVTSDVDDRAVMSGVPAKVVGRVEGHLSLERKDRIMRRLLPELTTRLGEQGLSPDGFVYEPAYDGRGGVHVVLTFQMNAEAAPDGTTVFDFGRKRIVGPQNRYTDEIRNFFRKRGVRFAPYAWRYTHDEGLFNL